MLYVRGRSPPMKSSTQPTMLAATRQDGHDSWTRPLDHTREPGSWTSPSVPKCTAFRQEHYISSCRGRPHIICSSVRCMYLEYPAVLSPSSHWRQAACRTRCTSATVRPRTRHVSESSGDHSAKPAQPLGLLSAGWPRLPRARRHRISLQPPARRHHPALRLRHATGRTPGNHRLLRHPPQSRATATPLTWAPRRLALPTASLPPGLRHALRPSLARGTLLIRTQVLLIF